MTEQLALLEAATALEKAGAIDEISFRIAKAIDYDTYEAVGRMLGRFKRATSWWIGDWLLFGQGVFSERFAQAADATGLAEGTLSTYMRVCERVPRKRRKVGVPFSVHEEVADLDPLEQKRWLSLAEKEGLSLRDLRQRMRGDEDDDGNGGGGGSTRRERIHDVAVAIWHQAQPVGNGTYIVPGELMARLREAIGEE